MLDTDCCTDEDITALVHAFYARVRDDAQLGPIFAAHIADWGPHLAKMVDFWSAVLRGTGRFTGSPMARHAAIPGLTADLFSHWVALFCEVAAEQPNREMADRASMAASRMARSLWIGYQLHGPSARSNPSSSI